MRRRALLNTTFLEHFIHLISFRTTLLIIHFSSESIVSSLAVKMIPYFLVSAALAVSAVASTADAAEYDYVIIGSGPGGGSLA